MVTGISHGTEIMSFRIFFASASLAKFFIAFKSLDAFLVKETEELLTSFVWYKEETGGRQGPYHLVPVLCPDSSRVLNKLRNVKVTSYHFLFLPVEFRDSTSQTLFGNIE